MLRAGARSEAGQAILIMAVGIGMLVALAALAIDAANLYLVRREAQNAVDFASFAAGKPLAAAAFAPGRAPNPGDPLVHAAHDFATLNGFPTVYSTTCDSASLTSFSATWFDSAGTACTATSGYLTRIQVNVPPVSINGAPIPSICTGPSTQYTCVQVVMTRRVDTFFARVFGVLNNYFTVAAVVNATPQIQGYTLPPPIAAYLYQPLSQQAPGGCRSPNTCFNESLPVTRALTCSAGACPAATGGSNSPTLWVRDNVNVSFFGTDGKKTIPVGGDVVTLQSNGDMVLQSDTVFCDPYNGAKCSLTDAVGANGFSAQPGSKLYCSGFDKGGTSNGLIGCTTTGQSSLNHLRGKETAFVTPTAWAPIIDTSGLASCGALILNGDPVSSSFIGAHDAECSSAAEPYVIEPGRYQYIVINHGTYEFESGFYDLTGTAPVNTLSAAGYRANGIDHSREDASGTKDWDLCGAKTPTGCPTLSASIWIGHGGGYFGPYSSGTAPGSCSGGGGIGGGGGDQTIVSGSSVSFRFESTAGGFVSTNEVQGISLSAPGIGSSAEVGGTPILFDLENSSFIHLDGQGSDKYVSQFSGLIYQTPAATGGGVEIEPGMASGKNSPALRGQVFAYSLTVFGTTGTAIDFTDGYGGVSQPPITTSGRAELSLVSSTSLTPAVDASGTVIPGQETLTINYTDEWALDAYDLYLRINNGQAVFFSQGVWNPTPPIGASLPPAVNNPGDSNPAYPGSPPAGYTAAADPITGQNTDWTYTIGSGATASKFEVSGNWTWGHEAAISGARGGNNRAIIKYTFPIPTGTSTNITIFLTDGDHCGDYYNVNATLNNVGQPNPGAQSGGSVVLVR